MTTADNVGLAKEFMEWFEEQGCQPSDAVGVMAIVIALMAKGPKEKRVLANFNRLITKTIEDLEF